MLIDSKFVEFKNMGVFLYNYSVYTFLRPLIDLAANCLLICLYF